MCEREGWRTISRKFVRKLWPEEMESGVCSALLAPPLAAGKEEEKEGGCRE